MNETAVFYFVLLSIATIIAWRSKCEPIQKLGIILFAGWCLYVPVKTILSAEYHILANLILDIGLLVWVVVLWRSWEEAICTKAHKAISGIFLLMLALHGLHLFIGLERYTYYLTYNLLFASQLVFLSVYAELERRRNKAIKANKKEVAWLPRMNVSRKLRVVPNTSRTG